LSGGMDSAVALFWAKQKGYRCFALSFDYGQRHKKELLCARRLANKVHVPHHVVRFALPWGGSTLTNNKARLPHHRLSQISRGGIPSTYVPARNTIFLSFALSWADELGAGAIVIGANAIDYSGYPDCRPNYLAHVEKVARLGSRLGSEKKIKIKILAPLVKLTKCGIVAMGAKLGVPFDLTWSCYQGSKQPCGLCDACQLREKGFKEYEAKIALIAKNFPLEETEEVNSI
jgi:7-cyano-7-deazaguanine synthase